MDLSGKKLVLIGGAGLIGSHTVDHLLAEDVKEIVIYDNFVRGREENLNSALKDSRVKIYDVGGDILQTDILESALENADGVFHFAALWLLQCHMYPRSAFDVNVRGTFNVMEACVKKGIRRLVYSSSSDRAGHVTWTNRVPASTSLRASKQLCPNRVRPYRSRIASDSSLSRNACTARCDCTKPSARS